MAAQSDKTLVGISGTVWAGAVVCLLLGFAVGWVVSKQAESVIVFSPPEVAAQQPEQSGASQSALENTAPSAHLTPVAARDSEKFPSGVPQIATLAETAEISSEFLQSAALYSFAAGLDADGIRGLIDSADKALTGGDYFAATSLLIGRYAELDFAGALDYALDNGGSSMARWLQSIFHARARIDFDEAVLVAADLNKNQQRIAGIAILRSNDYLSLTQRQSVIEQLNVPGHLLASTQHSSEEAWAELRSIQDVNQRAGAQSQVLMRWAQSDPWAALAASNEIENSDYRIGMQGTLLGFAAADDPQRAIDWINAQPAGKTRTNLISSVISQLGNTDFEAAERLLAQLPEAERVQAGYGLWSTRAASDPVGAAEWVASAAATADSAGYSRSGAAQILWVLGRSSGDAAERFMAALPVEQRAQLEPTYIMNLARTDPQQAARRLADVSDPQQYQTAARGLVQTWARSDPEAASRWVGLQSGENASAMFSALGVSWSQSDPQAAQTYARRMISGADRDHMLTGVISSGRIAAEDMPSMLNLIDDLTLRSQAERSAEAMRRALSGVNIGSFQINN